MICPLKASKLATAYLIAKEFVIRSGFHSEIDWQERLSFTDISERDFLREMAWVVFSAGFRENVLRKRFGQISEAFLQWSSADAIYHARDACRERALRVFNHPQKIQAILTTAQLTFQKGFPVIKRRIKSEGVEFLKQLSFVGPVTAFHLAKNLGLPAVKPDRHLVRIARVTGYDCPDSMCKAIASVVAEKISVIDLVIWRFATLNPHYEVWFSDKASQCDTGVVENSFTTLRDRACLAPQLYGSLAPSM